MYCGAREHSRHKSATCKWLSAQDQTVTGADNRGQRHTSILSEITCCAVHNTRRQIRLSVYLKSFHHRRSISRRRVRRRSRAFPSSFLPLPSAPQPQNASLSEFYAKICKSTWGNFTSRRCTNLDQFRVSCTQQFTPEIPVLGEFVVYHSVHLCQQARKGWHPQGNEKVNVPR